MPETLSPHALCTEQDVLDWVGEESPSVRETNIAIRLANEASDKITRLSGREFNPDVETSAGRPFSGLEILRVRGESPVLEIGDASTVTAVAVAFFDGGSQALTEDVHFRELPRRRLYAWEPIEAIEFLPDAPAIGNRDTITVTGEWGFPAVPEDVRGEAIKAAGLWFEREVRRHSEAFGGEEPASSASGAEAARALPRSAWELALWYRHRRYG